MCYTQQWQRETGKHDFNDISSNNKSIDFVNPFIAYTQNTHRIHAYMYVLLQRNGKTLRLYETANKTAFVKIVSYLNSFLESLTSLFPYEITLCIFFSLPHSSQSASQLLHQPFIKFNAHQKKKGKRLQPRAQKNYEYINKRKSRGLYMYIQRQRHKQSARIEPTAQCMNFYVHNFIWRTSVMPCG